MDDHSRLQVFYLRTLLAAGILWGLVPLITVPFIFRGSADTALDVWAALSNGLTIFPASVLAFWHRRIACVWLISNASLLAISIAFSSRQLRDYRVAVVIGFAVSELLAVLLGFTEIRRWPGALERLGSGRVPNP